MLDPKPSHTTSDASDPVPQSTMPLPVQAMVAVKRPRPKTAMKMTIVKVHLAKRTTRTIVKVPNAQMTTRTRTIVKVPNAQMTTRTTTTTKKKHQKAPPPWLPPPLLLLSSLPLFSDQIENRV